MRPGSISVGIGCLVPERRGLHAEKTYIRWTDRGRTVLASCSPIIILFDYCKDADIVRSTASLINFLVKVSESIFAGPAMPEPIARDATG